MAFRELIIVQCDETGAYLPVAWIRRAFSMTRRNARFFECHSKAIKFAVSRGWHITGDECLSPQGYRLRYGVER